MINIILKPWHLKNLQLIQNIKNLMFQVIFIFSDWILIKQIRATSVPFCCRRKKIFERMLPEGMNNFLLRSAWWQILRGEFWVRGAWVKMPRINAFSRIVNSINSKIFPRMVEHKSLKENSTSTLERKIKP